MVDRCRPRCERLTLAPSCDLEGFDLLVCRECGRPIRLRVKGVRQVPAHRPKRGELQRALRASRRAAR